MAASTSPAAYRRMKNIRTRINGLKDGAMTGNPRYGKSTVLSHRRGDKRMKRWIQYG